MRNSIIIIIWIIVIFALGLWFLAQRFFQPLFVDHAISEAKIYISQNELENYSQEDISNLQNYKSKAIWSYEWIIKFQLPNSNKAVPLYIKKTWISTKVEKWEYNSDENNALFSFWLYDFENDKSYPIDKIWDYLRQQTDKDILSRKDDNLSSTTWISTYNISLPQNRNTKSIIYPSWDSVSRFYPTNDYRWDEDNTLYLEVETFSLQDIIDDINNSKWRIDTWWVVINNDIDIKVYWEAKRDQMIETYEHKVIDAKPTDLNWINAYSIIYNANTWILDPSLDKRSVIYFTKNKYYYKISYLARLSTDYDKYNETIQKIIKSITFK